MNDFDFNAFLDDVEKKLVAIASETAGEFKDAAIADGKAFVEASKESLKRWVKMLASGELSEADFADLVEGEKDLAEMVALKQTVITKVQLNKFKDGLIGAVTKAALERIAGSN